LTTSANDQGHGRDEHEREHRHRRRKRRHQHRRSNTDRHKQREVIWTFVAILVAGLLALVAIEWGNIVHQAVQEAPSPRRGR
jgi:heme/copper-type cytochrome/quinol oxidase subunit 2